MRDKDGSKSRNVDEELQVEMNEGGEETHGTHQQTEKVDQAVIMSTQECRDLVQSETDDNPQVMVIQSVDVPDLSLVQCNSLRDKRQQAQSPF